MDLIHKQEEMENQHVLKMNSMNEVVKKLNQTIKEKESNWEEAKLRE